MKIILPLIIFIAIGASLFVYSNTKNHKVVQATQYTVLYEDGISEFVYRDDFGGYFSVYRAPLASYWVDEQKAGWGWGPVGWRAPSVSRMGPGNSERVLFSVENSDDISCLQDVIIADRKAHETKKAHTELCVENTLDEHDFTHFFGVLLPYKNKSSDNNKKTVIGVGDYLTGNSIATTTISLSDNESFLSEAVSDWEMTHILFMTGMCDTHISKDTYVRVYDFNTIERTITEATPSWRKLPVCFWSAEQ